MSRIGNRILKIPEGIEANLREDSFFYAKSAKGELKLKIPRVIKVEIKEKELKTLRINEIKHTKQLHGTINSLINGMFEGLTKGFSKELLIQGVGYKCNLQGNKLNLALGFSHPVVYEVPEGINLTVPSPTKILIAGINKQLVGEVAAKIRSYKKPEPYKGKGIRYSDEIIIRKEGKAAGK
ncbi:50S ribosomal protein L6 [Spiroplasma endosymbiont of Amphibalanus improvisus]|uniref:50S ribosomal protein L6 n=1 Tax=Spiroplasma endosymbiont of Amphibalanus improvisus TaxID=3066327 RepID=UPI00313E54D5